MDNVSYSYKLGVKEEIINALRGVFGSTYPDPQYANRVEIVSEYPEKSIKYPAIIVKFNSNDVKNIGVAHFEIDPSFPAERVLHWRFLGSITFEVWGNTPIDRDKILAGLTNIFAFGSDIPAFANFRSQVMNQRFITLVPGWDSIQEGMDTATTPPWNPSSNELVFTNSITLQCFGEFFTTPSTGNMVEVDEVDIYPTVDLTLPPAP